MREVKLNRVPFNPNGTQDTANNRVPFNPSQPQLREGDTNIITPKYTTPKDLEIDNTLNFIQENSLRTMRDDEKDILKNMMKNPLTSKEELSDAIVTLQGKKAKQVDNSWLTPDYYMKRDEKSGNYKPIALEQNEKIPFGHNAASIWGTKESAKDDNAWQDIGKSLANGVVAFAGGVLDVAQTGIQLATGSESETLRGGENALETFKFEKDADLDRSIYNTEGITKFADLLDKDRFDFSPQALWGAFNSTAESLTEFGLGTLTGASWIKGAKALKYGYQGIDKALDLQKAGKFGAIFTGSFFTNIGDGKDRAEEAGLKGRDIATYGLAEATVKSTIDAAFGLEGKIMSNLFKNTTKETLKTVIKKAERDAITGAITPNGFKQLMKEVTVEYSSLAKNLGVKGGQIVKDMFEEGSNELATDFAQKAGENLWDKMTEEERGRFGTDALDAKSFGSYANSFFTGAVSGAPMSLISQGVKSKHDSQSVNAYDRVKEGPQAVEALKTDLTNAVQKGDITQSEHDEAIFKIDAYNKYHEETKNANLKPEDEKKAFELSFQIQGLKTEIPTNENEISKLEPIARAKVESKQKQSKELQSELNDIIRQGEIKGEPVTPKKEEERIKKEQEKIIKEKEKETISNLKQNEAPKTPKVEKPKKVLEQHVTLEGQPKWQDDKRTYDEIPAEDFNNHGFNARTAHRTLRKKLSLLPNKEMTGKLAVHEFEYMKDGKVIRNRTIKVDLEDGRTIKLASSMIRKGSGELSGYVHTERLKSEDGEKQIDPNNYRGEVPDTVVGVKVVDLNNPSGLLENNEFKPGKKVIKVYDKKTGSFLSWIKETNTGATNVKDKDGNSLYSAEDLDLLEALKQTKFNEKPLDEDGIKAINKPIIPVKPTIVQRADAALDNIVKEGKEKIAKKPETKPKEKEYKDKKPKENGKEENPTNGEKSTRGNNEKTNGEDKGEGKTIILKTSKNRLQRKVKNPDRKKAMKLEVSTARELALMYFVEGGLIDRDSLKSFFKGSEPDAFARQNMTKKLDEYNPRIAPNLDDLAHRLWEDNHEKYPNIQESEYKDSVEDAINENVSPIAMAKKLNEAHGVESHNRLEELLAGVYVDTEKEGIDSDKVDIVVDTLEVKTDIELTDIADGKSDFTIEDDTTDLIRGEEGPGQFQKVSQRKGDITKVVAAITKAFNKDKIEVVVDASKFTGEQSEIAGKVSADGKTIYINPNYAGLDSPIHEAGHVLIDAMGYNNKIIQAAIKQLRGTDLYAETKERYKELSESELDKEVLAEAIGREGADIFTETVDKSKFKQYLDYIFDWLKQKLGVDKNIAKSLSKQIISGIGTKNLEGTNTGKEQLQKNDKTKNKSPLGARPLRFDQYAAEHGFSYEKETEKMNEASFNLDEAKEKEKDALIDGTEEEYEEAAVELKAAQKAFAIAWKRNFEYKKYKKDFNEIQKLMAEKEMTDYTTEELQDLISKLHGFDNKAAKAVRQEAMLKFAMIATKKQQEIFEGKTGYIADLAKTKDITPLQQRILHHSHFSENNADMQAVSLSFGNAIMNKITDANTRKATHEKLGQKVIAEENKRLGIVGAQSNRFSSDSAKYFEWMTNADGELMTIDEAKAKGLSEAKTNYLKFTRETIADYKGQLEENDFENAVMDAIRIDKGFMEAYKSEGLLPAFSYYLGGGANNLGKVRIVHNGQIKSYSEIEKEILATADRKSITSMAKALFDLLVANIQARKQLKKGFNVDEKENPLELKGEAEYSLNHKGQLVSKFDKPRAKDRGYSKDFYKAMNQFIDESAHTRHISKIMPLVDSVEYLNKNGYMDEGYIIKPNVAKWIAEWKALHIFKEPYVNDPVIDASIKFMRKLVASTTMWFNIPANALNVFMGNYSNWRQENGKTVVLGNKRLFGGKDKNRAYGLDIIKKYNIVNQDYDSNATMKYGSILSKLGNIGTQMGEYQIQGSLGLGLLNEDEFNSFEYTKDKYGNEILTVKPNGKYTEDEIKAKIIQIKNRVTDIQGKYPDEDRRNIMKGEFGKAAFQFKVWIPDFIKERFSARYINAYGVEREGTFSKVMREGLTQIKKDINQKGVAKAFWENKALMSNIKGLATIGTLMALAHQDDDEEAKKGSLSFQSALSQVLFILDLEQDKYMVSNPAAALGKTKDLLSAFEALLTADEKAFDKIKRIVPANKITKVIDVVQSITE